MQFINKYVSLEDLIGYLKRTDLYLFTSKNPNQAVSGTLAYAMACGCPIISTPIPHAKELLDGAGINFDFQDSEQLAERAIKLLYDASLLKQMRLNALHRISPTSWQNAAISHIEVAQKISGSENEVSYRLPEISLDHIKRLTTKDGLVQFSKMDIPDLASGYTLDDNSRALIALVRHYDLTSEAGDLALITTYLDFVLFCQKDDGLFLNYVDKKGVFDKKNQNENLEDSNGRAIWALGEFLSYGHLFDESMVEKVNSALNKSLKNIDKFQSPRAISFAIKGLCHYDLACEDPQVKELIVNLADNLVSKYRGVADKKWQWFEDSLTYANSVLAEALLYASISTGSELYRGIAKSTFDFLMTIMFQGEQITVVSNQGWHHKSKSPNRFGEQPIDVAYTVLALNHFFEVFNEEDYQNKMNSAFSWFLGKNHLSRIVYNPCTGGCYDGLEEDHINLNQGAESAVSYLLARLAVEKNSNDSIPLPKDLQWRKKNNTEVKIVG